MIHKWLGTFFLYGVARDLRSEPSPKTNISRLWTHRAAFAMMNGLWYMNGVIPIIQTMNRFQLRDLNEESRNHYSAVYEEMSGVNKNILL